jgi:putative hemolysin
MKWILTLIVILMAFASASCTAPQTTPTPPPVSTEMPQANMPNPASVFCEQQGNSLEIRIAADGSQSGVCIFPDGSECDEWAYFRGECAPPTQSGQNSSPTEIPTAMPIDPADYQGWWTYTHAVYGFSIMLPEDWSVDETTVNDPLMNGHMLMLHPQLQGEGAEGLLIRMTFRRTGEDTLLWPTGVGAGEFIQQGTLDVAVQPARRILFVCPTGQVNGIWYHGMTETEPNIQRGDMEFGFIFSLTGFYCEEGHSLGGKVQRVGDMIIASLKVP